MSKAICFNCEHELVGVEKSMEDILKFGLPLFCCVECGADFPDNGTKEFKIRMKLIKEKIKSLRGSEHKQQIKGVKK